MLQIQIKPESDVLTTNLNPNRETVESNWPLFSRKYLSHNRQKRVSTTPDERKIRKHEN